LIPGISSFQQLALNLGGEGETPDVLNQQPTWVDLASLASRTGKPLGDALHSGEAFLFCDNRRLPFPDTSLDVIITNGVPIDVNTWLGPGVQSSEIRRVLRRGGEWHDNGTLVFTKP
jgi:hypothetical protein